MGYYTFSEIMLAPQLTTLTRIRFRVMKRLVTLKHKYLNGHQQEESHPVSTQR